MLAHVRVRFAPSPTGYLHVGSIRSGLFNWLWARHNQGVFVLRIEDTDRARLVDDALTQIIAAHDALGITPDEGPVQGGEYGPYLQSERLDLYRQQAATLAEAGSLYPCWCTPERLDGLRTEAQQAGHAFKYDRYCLEHPKTIAEPHVLRFKVPPKPEVIGWDDAVRGYLEFKTAELDDFVAIKSDKFPTYHFANVVDDHLMAISHVLRADEWIPSTPKHLLLFAAFGWTPPIYAHLPAVQGPDGKKKLSKRDGAQSVQEYLDEGYLPEAIMSFLASLGWNDGTTQEVFTADELIAKFSLERIQRSPAQFDRERLTWMNGLLIRRLDPSKLLERIVGFWPVARDSPRDYQLRVLALVQERLKTLGEIEELTDFFFVTPTLDSNLLCRDYSSDEAKALIEQLITMLGQTEWSEQYLETTIRDFVETHKLKTGSFFGLLRVAVTGRTAAPGLFETMAVLGQKTALDRLSKAVKSL